MIEKSIRKDDAPSLINRFKSSNAGGVFLTMVVFIIIVVALSGPKFFQISNLLNLLRSISVTGIMACAVTLVIITANIDLSLGWLIGLCSCVAAVYSGNTVLAILLPVIVGGAGGLLNGILVGKIKLNPFITTLGTMYFFKGLAMLYANSRIITAANNPTLKFYGQGYILKVPVPVWVLAITVIVFWFILKRTVYGSHVYVVGSNRVNALFSGISSANVILIAYVLTGLATGLAGSIFFAQVMSTQAYSGAGLEFDVITAVVLGGTSITGGKGSIGGTVLGTIFVGVLSNGFTMMGLPSTAQYIFQGIILIIAIRADILKGRRLKL